MADKNDEGILSQAVEQAIVGVTGTEAAEGVDVLQNALSSLNATDTVPLSVIASNLSYIKDTAKNAAEEIEKLDTKLENFANVNELISYVNKKYANGMANLITAEDRRASGYTKVAVEEKKARIKEKETPEYKERQKLENEKIKQQIAERNSTSYKKAVSAKNEITIRQNETQKNLEANNPDFFVTKELQKVENQKLKNQEIENKISTGYFAKMANKAEAQADWIKSPEHLIEVQTHIKSRNNWSEQTAIANIVKTILGADFLAEERKNKNENLSLRNAEKAEQLNANYVQIKADQMTVATQLSKERTIATENKNRITAALGDEFAIKTEQLKQEKQQYTNLKNEVAINNGIPQLQADRAKRNEETAKSLLSADKDFFVKSEQAKQHSVELNNSIEELKLLNGYYEEQAKSIKKHNEVLNLLSDSFLKANEEEKATSLALKNRREQILLDNGFYEEKIKSTKLNNDVNNILGADFLADKEKLRAEALKNTNLKNEVAINNGIPQLQADKAKRNEETAKGLLSSDKNFFVKSEQIKQYSAELNNSIEELKFLNGFYDEQAKSIKRHNEILNLLSDSFLKANEEEKATSLALRNRREQMLLDNGFYEEKIKGAKLDNEINDILGADFLADTTRLRAEALKNTNLKNEYWQNNGGLDADLEAKKLANQLKGADGYVDIQIKLLQARAESLRKQNELNEALGNEALLSEKLADIANKQAKAKINALKAEENETEEHKKATKARNQNTIDNRAFDEQIDQKDPTLREKAREAGYKKKIINTESAEIRLENLKSKVFGEGFAESVRKALAGVEHRFTSRSGFVGVASRFTENMLKDKWVMGREVDSSGNVIKAGTQLGGLRGGGITLMLEKIYKWAVQYGKEAMRAFGEIESIKTNLNVVYGSQSLASQSFNEIADYAIKSPFGIQQMTEFAILLKQSGVESVDLMTTLKQIGDVAGGNQEKFQRIANNYAQIIAANRATALDLRQFANAGLPIYQEIRKELGVSQKEVRDMTRDGLVGAKTIQKVFKNMTSKGGVFYNAVNQGAKTYKARVQNMSDTKQLNFSEIGKWLYNFNGWGNNSTSIFKDVLNTLEGIYSVIGGWAKYRNQKRIINAQVPYQKEYERIINALMKADSPQEKQQLTTQLHHIEKFYDYNKLRQNQADKYDNVVAKREIAAEELKEANKLLSIYLTIRDPRKKSLIQEEFQDVFQKNINDFYREKSGLSAMAIFNTISSIIDSKVLKNPKLKQASQIRKGETLLSDSNSYVINNSKQEKSTRSLVDKYSELYKQTSAYKDDVEKNKIKEIENLSNAKKIEQKYGITDINYNAADSSRSFGWIKEFYNSKDVGNSFGKFSSVVKNQYSTSDSGLILTPEDLIRDKKELNRTFSVLKTNLNLFSSIFDALGEDIDNIAGGTEALEIYKKYNDFISENKYKEPEKLGIKALKDFAGEIGATKEEIDKLSDDNPFKDLFPLLFTELVHDSLKDIDTNKLLKDTLPQWERIMQKTLSIPEEVFKKAKISTSGALSFSTAMNEKSIATNFTQQMLASGLKVSDITDMLLPRVAQKSIKDILFNAPDFDLLNPNFGSVKLKDIGSIPIDRISGVGKGLSPFSNSVTNQDNKTIYEFDDALNTTIKSLFKFSTKLEDVRSFNSSDAANLYKDIALGYSSTGNVNFDNKLNSGSLANQFATDLSNFTTTLSTLLSQGMFQAEDSSLLYDKESMKKLGLQDGDIESFKKKFVALGFTFDEEKQAFKNVSADVVQSLLDLSSNLSVTATTVATFKKEIENNKNSKDKQDFILDANKRYASLKKRYNINEDTLEEGFGTAYDSFAEQAKQEGYDNTSSFMKEALNALVSGDASLMLSRSKEISNTVSKENNSKIEDLNDSIEDYISKNMAVSDWLIENGGFITSKNISDFITAFGKQFPELQNFATIDTESLNLSDTDKKSVLLGILDEFFKSLYDKKSTDASKGKDALPFYKRLSGSIFNIPDSVLKNLNGSRDIFDYRNAANTRLSNEAIAKALVKDTGNFNFFKDQIAHDNTFVGIGDNRTQSVNQEKTFNNLEKLALSLNTNSSVTNAYAEQLKNQKEQLENLMSAAAFRIEDADKVTTKELAEQLGYTLNDIKALENLINAFSLTGNESLSSLLDKTYQYTSALEATTSTLGAFKSVLEESTTNTDKTRFDTNNIFAKTNIPRDIYTSKMDKIYELVNSSGIAKSQNKSIEDFIKEAETAKIDVKATENYESFLKEQTRLGGLLKDGKGDLSEEIGWEKYYKKTGGENGVFTYEKINATADALVVLIQDILAAANTEAGATKNKEGVQSLREFTDKWGRKSGDKNLETIPENWSDNSTSVSSKVAGAFDFMNLRSYTDYEGNSMSKFGKNTREQQIAMNWLAENGDTEASKKDIREWASGRISNFNSLKAESKTNAIEEAKNAYLQIGEENGIDDYINKVESVFDKIKDGSADSVDALAKLGEEFGLAGAKTGLMNTRFSELVKNIKSTAKSQFLNSLNESFVQIGKNISDGESASDGLYNIWKNMASTILGTIGATMTSTGLEIAAEGARTNNKSDIAKGLALAAAGGVAGIASGMLSDSSSSDSDDEKAEEQRIQNLKDALADLIDQAKTDAEYYQKNLMHKKALASNDTISAKTIDVNDAIITPNGNVVSTHPDDYLIATKTPEQFIGGSSSGVNLQVNSIVNNNSSNVTATTETVENEDGSIDIITTICDVVNSGLAEGKFDDGLSAYEYRQQGRSVAS